MIAAAISARQIAGGAARVVGLLGERTGGVEAVHHVGAHDAADQQGAREAPAVSVSEAEVVHDDLRPSVDVEQQQDHQDRGADQLGEHAEVVDARHDLDAKHVDDRCEHDKDGPEDDRVLRAVRSGVGAGVSRPADELEAARDLRQHDLPGHRHRGDRDDRPDDVDPARHPGDEVARDALRPLVHRSGERVLARELREAQRDEHLAGEHDQPRPPHRGTSVQEPEAEQLEDAGQDRDVAEASRERGETAQRAVELLLVAEGCEFARVVAGGCCGHSLSSLMRRRSRHRGLVTRRTVVVCERRRCAGHGHPPWGARRG